METTALASSFLLLTAIMGQMKNSDEAPILSLNRARLEMSEIGNDAVHDFGYICMFQN